MSEIPIATVLHVIHPEAATIGDMTVMLPETPDLEVLNAILRPLLGGAFVHVHISAEDGVRDMFVHETGEIDRLPVNETATRLYRAGYMTMSPDAEPGDLPAIYGPAVVFTRRVWRPTAAGSR